MGVFLFDCFSSVLFVNWAGDLISNGGCLILGILLGSMPIF